MPGTLPLVGTGGQRATEALSLARDPIGIHLGSRPEQGAQGSLHIP